MHLLHTAKLLTLILLSSIFTALPVQANVTYSPAKQRLCQSCDMPRIPITLPKRGIVIAYGSIFGEGSMWYLVDLELAQATRILASVDRTTRDQMINEQVTRPLSFTEGSALIQLTNRIWAKKEALPTQMATDVVWDLWLLDDGDVRHEFAAGRPDGLAKEVERVLEDVLKP